MILIPLFVPKTLLQYPRLILFILVFIQPNIMQHWSYLIPETFLNFQFSHNSFTRFNRHLVFNPNTSRRGVIIYGTSIKMTIASLSAIFTRQLIRYFHGKIIDRYKFSGIIFITRKIPYFRETGVCLDIPGGRFFDIAS